MTSGVLHKLIKESALTETLPQLDEGKLTDTAVQIMLCRPARNSATSYRFPFRDVASFEASWVRRGIGAMRFSTYKDDPASEKLHVNGPPGAGFNDDRDEVGTEDYELAVRLWDWRLEEWIERPNSRFVVASWDEDTADGTNLISYACQQSVVMLDRVKLKELPESRQLNRDYDRALEAFEEAERELDQLLNQFTTAGRRVQEDRFGHTAGQLYAGYRGTGWIASSRPVRWGTITADTMRGALMIYQPSSRSWLRLPHNQGSDTDSDRQQMVQLSPQIRRARTRMRRARDQYARAERAARETARDGTRYFHNSVPARVLQRAWTEGRERERSHDLAPNSTAGTAPRNLRGQWRDWDYRRGSSNRTWASTTPASSWEFPLGIGFLDMVNDFQERGLLDWCMTGDARGNGGRTFSLYPYGALEVDQTERVRLSHDVEEALERGTRMEHASVHMVIGGHGYSYHMPYGADSPTHHTPWGRLEGTIQESEAESWAVAQRLTQRQRQEDTAREIRDSTRRMSLGVDSAIPVIDFMPHHWVSVWDHDSSASARIVDQIILSFDDENPLTATVVMGTRRERSLTSLNRTLSKTLQGIDHMQGHIPRDSRLDPPDAPTGALMAPSLHSLSASLRYDLLSGRPSVVLRAQWGDEGMEEPEVIDEDPSEDEYDTGG